MATEKWYCGICKQVNQGDSIVVREKVAKGQPITKTIGITNISCPRLQFRPQNVTSEVVQDEAFAWEAREFLRVKAVGQPVVYTQTQMQKGGFYGDVYIGQTPALENNIAYMMVCEGFAEVRKINNQEVIAKNKIYQQLVDAENVAKATLKGRWNTDAKVVGRSVCWNIASTTDFLAKNSGKELKAVVEYVRDGCSMQVCILPTPEDGLHYPITVSLSGIRTPGFKGAPPNQVADKFAEQAKAFVESRLLQRTVNVKLISLIGTQNFSAMVSHPVGGDISEYLLTDGLAHCLEWGMENLPAGTSSKYRQLESAAKEKRLNIWRDFKPPTPISDAQIKMNQQKLANSGTEFSGTIIEVGLGDNVTVKCDNGLVKKFYLASLRPVRPTMEAPTDGEAPQKVKVTKPLYDIPYMFEARELLRKNIGKRVNVHVDYNLPKPENAASNYEERVCATLEVEGGVNPALVLISKGLAQVVRYKRNSTDPRAKCYEQLLAAEEEAASKAVGWHSKGPAPVHRIKEVTGAASKALLPAFQRAGKLHGVVEFVASAGRLKVFIPQQNNVITLLLADIDYPKTARGEEKGDPLGEEATNFTKEHCLQRNIDIEVDGLDRKGNFTGYAYLHQHFSVMGAMKSGDQQIKSLSNSGKIVSKMLNCALVLQGYATLRGFKSANHAMLSKAQSEAQAAKNGMWANAAFLAQWQREQNNNETVAAPEELENDKPSVQDLSIKDKDDSKVKAALANRIKSAKRAHLLEVSLNESTSDTAVRLFLQLSEDCGKMQEIQRELNSRPPTSGECATFKPQRGQLCAAKFSQDNQWYRAQVLSISDKSVGVLFVDYGNSEDIPAKKQQELMGPLPGKLVNTPLVTRQYRIGGICMPPETEDRFVVMETLTKMVGQSEVLMAMESSTPVPCNKDDKKPVPVVNLFLQSNAAQSSDASQQPQDVAQILISQGLVYVEKSRMPQDQRVRYEDAQEKAKKARSNIWRYGDCRPDD